MYMDELWRLLDVLEEVEGAPASPEFPASPSGEATWMFAPEHQEE